MFIALPALLFGCVPAPAPFDTADEIMTEAAEEDVFRGFSWVVDGVLAGMPQPNADELTWIAGEGVVLLVSLTETGADPLQAEAAGLQVLHVPVPDMTAPTMEQLMTVVTAIDARREAGEPVGIHCFAGMGRTGTALAAWLVWEGMSAARAIAHVRDLRPGSIETVEQEAAIGDFEALLRRR